MSTAQTSNTEQTSETSRSHSIRSTAPHKRHEHTRSNSSNKTSSTTPSSPIPALRPTPASTGAKSPLSQASPTTSRETSPIRHFLTPQNTLHARDASSRPRNALSPSRSSSLALGVSGNGMSGTASRSLSTTSNNTTPRPSAINEAVTKLWNSQRQEQRDALPSPRLKSPTAPSSNNQGRIRSNSSSAKHGPESSMAGVGGSQDPAAAELEEPLARVGSAASKVHRGYSGRMLETVEEGDQAISPLHEASRSISSSISEERPLILQEHTIHDPSNTDTSDVISLASQDGGDAVSISADRTSSLKKVDSRRDSSSTVRKAYSVLAPSKVRANNDSSSNKMTVETETVASIPSTIIPSAAERAPGRNDGGTLRKMTSVETIRPKKKKVLKKPPSIISGTTASKADIFEAKVASAVDEDESDSDETFVYESNPPETRHRQNRHHSRTPSNTSMQSMRDRRTSARPAGNLLDNHRRVRGKRSMKFVSNSYAQSPDEDSGDNGQGTVRASHVRRGPGGAAFLASDLYMQNNADAQSPLLLEESPYSQAAKQRNQGANSRHSSKADTQMVPSPMYLRSPTRKGPSSPYEYTGTDERSPLVGSVRGHRLRSYQRQQGGRRQLDYYTEDAEGRGWLSRFAGCVVMTIIVMLVTMAAAAFLFATSKPLYEVQVHQIQNVIASEQEIMLDLLVEAFNPNIVAITVGEMDVNVFARSRYLTDGNLIPEARSSSLHARRWLGWRGTHDHGTDPMPDPSADPQTMLLGRVYDFDSVLYFDGSPLRRLSHNSTGEFRLPAPTNKTEPGAHEKWERILKHPFELIVKGILKYQLPLSSRTMTVGISANTTVGADLGELGRIGEALVTQIDDDE